MHASQIKVFCEVEEIAEFSSYNSLLRKIDRQKISMDYDG